MTEVTKADLVEAGATPASIRGAHISIRLPLIGELDQMEKGGLAFAHICPSCSDTHLVVITGDACISVSLTPKEAEALGRALLAPAVLKHDPSCGE